MKTCGHCSLTKPFDEFYRKGTGYQSWCKLCVSMANRQSYERHKDRKQAEGRVQGARWRSALKLETFHAYGGPVCTCCGETTTQFLTIDHIHGGGNKHRKSLGTVRTGKGFYMWLKQQGFPKGYQVLCFNCNVGRSINGGVCPHQETLVKP